VPLDDDFKSYLDADGIFVPIGSEDVYVQSYHHFDGDSNLYLFFRPLTSTLDDYGVDHDSDDEVAIPSTQYSFLELDAQIRNAINEYGAVFPKLNFSSPKVREKGTSPLSIFFSFP